MKEDQDRRLTDPFMEDVHTLIEHVGAMKESLARIEVQMVRVEDHHRTLYGTGGLPGLTIVVDRLNELDRSRRSHIAMAWTAIIGLLAKVGWDVVATHRAP